MTFPFPTFMPGESRTLYQILIDLGLTTNLKLCFDAADSASYGGSGETFTDRAGTQDFWFGAAGTTDGDEPTFNGTAGRLSVNEYMSVDGGDHFRAKAQPAFIQNLHKDGAKFSGFAVSYRSAGASHSLIGTLGVSTATIGFLWSADANHSITIFNDSHAPALSQNSSAAAPQDAWGCFGMTIDENGGADAGFLWRNGAYDPVSGNDTWNPSYSLPNSSDASFTVSMFARGDGQLASGSGCRIACLALWEGGVLTKANLDAIYNDLNGERGYV